MVELIRIDCGSCTAYVASLAFGLLTATILSLFLIPSCFVIFDELGWMKRDEKEGQVVDGISALKAGTS
ncbi:MAG: hypothetical protein GY696_00550 [Gammaproteobacteria bacterium]|nr:hypothetical protein [Gammaproteobacteria bacterium]